jgi:multiple sugar transport system permease protein
MIPTEVVIIPEFLLMAKLDWLDTYLPLIVPSFLVGTFGTFMLREFFMSIPEELVEAARLDGATIFQVYRTIFLPLSLPAMTTLFLIGFIHNWNELLRPVLYISTSDLRTVTIGLTSFQNEYGAQWNLLLSGAVISILPLLIVYILAQRYVVEGIATTGLK